MTFNLKPDLLESFHSRGEAEILGAGQNLQDGQTDMCARTHMHTHTAKASLFLVQIPTLTKTIKPSNLQVHRLS